MKQTKIPKLNQDKYYTLNEIATRWGINECFSHSLPKHWTENRRSHGFHQSVASYIRGFIESGEIEGVVIEDKLGINVSVNGNSFETFEREIFHDCYDCQEHENKRIGENDSSGDIDRDDYPDELSIANQAWRAVAVNGQGGEGTAKQRLVKWLNGSGYGLNAEQVKRIATVCNWDKGRGRK